MMKQVGTVGMWPLVRKAVGDSPTISREGTAESAQAVETDIEANVRYAALRGAQKKHGTLDAPALEIAVWSLAERSAEGADKMRLGHLRNARESGNAERFGKRDAFRRARHDHDNRCSLLTNV